MPNFGIPSTSARPRGLAALLLLTALSWNAGAAPARAAADDSQTSFQDVPVDLSGRLFEQVLPFDVPFLIHGSVPGTTRRVEVRYVRRSRPFRICDPESSKDCPDGRFTCFESQRDGRELAVQDPTCAWQPAQGGPLVWEQEVPPPAGTETATFRVAVPPLEAKSYYVFSFGVRRRLIQADLDLFQEHAREALDPVLRRIGDTEATTQQNEALRRELFNQLAVAAGPGLRLEPKNLFDLSVPYRQLPPERRVQFNAAVGDVLITQDRVRENLRQRSKNNQPKLEAELAAIADAASLDELIQGLTAVAGQSTPSSGLVKEFLDSHQEALRFAALSAREQANLSVGLPEAGTAGAAEPVFDERVEPEVAAQFAASYRATGQQLEDLADWLDMLVDRNNRGLLQAAIAAGPLTAAEADDRQNGLAAVLGHVRRASGFALALASNARQVATNQQARTDAIAALALEAEVQARAVAVVLDASTLGSFKTQQAWYIAADFGFAFGPDIDKVVPYIGTNIYFRPVNKAAPLSERSSFGRRFSFTLGLTVKTIADEKPQTRGDLFDSNSLLAGVGYRVTDSGRLGLGVLVFEKLDPNPLLKGKSLTYSPYLSLSFDWDILGFFKNFSGIFGINNPG